MNDVELAKIERRIYSIREVRVILDTDLAAVYGVATNDPTPRPKLRAFIEQATAEGSEPLDLNLFHLPSIG